MVPRFFAVSRAWLRKTVRNYRNMDFGLGGPTVMIDFKSDELFDTRAGSNPTALRPFYQSDATRLFSWYHG